MWVSLCTIYGCFVWILVQQFFSIWGHTCIFHFEGCFLCGSPSSTTEVCPTFSVSANPVQKRLKICEVLRWEKYTCMRFDHYQWQEEPSTKGEWQDRTTEWDAIKKSDVYEPAGPQKTSDGRTPSIENLYSRYSYSHHHHDKPRFDRPLVAPEVVRCSLPVTMNWIPVIISKNLLITHSQDSQVATAPPSFYWDRCLQFSHPI